MVSQKIENQSISVDLLLKVKKLTSNLFSIISSNEVFVRIVVADRALLLLPDEFMSFKVFCNKEDAN